MLKTDSKVVENKVTSNGEVHAALSTEFNFAISCEAVQSLKNIRFEYSGFFYEFLGA